MRLPLSDAFPKAVNYSIFQMTEATNSERIPLMWRRSLARVTSFGFRPQQVIVPTLSNRDRTVTPVRPRFFARRAGRPERDNLEIVRVAFESRFERERAITRKDSEKQWQLLKRFYQEGADKKRAQEMRTVKVFDKGMVDGIAVERQDFIETTGKPRAILRLPRDRPPVGDCPRVFFWG